MTARRCQSGVVSLEAALALPVAALCLLALLQAAGMARDALVVQEAARAGARVAATTAADGAVTAAVRAAVGDRPVEVTVTPAARSPGTTVVVEVTLASRFGPFAPRLHGRAAFRGEPVLDRPSSRP